MHESEKWKGSHSVVSDSSRPNGLQPTRLLRPWDFPGKEDWSGCHCLLLFTGTALERWVSLNDRNAFPHSSWKLAVQDGERELISSEVSLLLLPLHKALPVCTCVPGWSLYLHLLFWWGPQSDQWGFTLTNLFSPDCFSEGPISTYSYSLRNQRSGL